MDRPWMAVGGSRSARSESLILFTPRRRPNAWDIGYSVLTKPRRLPQRLVQPRLPAGPAGSEMVDHRLVEAERDLALGRAGRAAAADDLVADPDLGALEPIVIHFRRVIRIHPIAFRIFFAHRHWPFASR